MIIDSKLMIGDEIFKNFFNQESNGSSSLNIIRKPSTTLNRDSIKSNADPKSKLESLGIEVFNPQENKNFSWDNLVGYKQVKQEIEDTVINSLKYPDLYDEVTKQTRQVYESNRPKAVLLEGLPGTGKTLTARIIASQIDRTFIRLKLEDIVSKWYGDSEKKLAQIFDYCDELEDGVVIFIDEIDALASSRDDHTINEATRHILSVILQRIEGFHGKNKSLLICATNRKNDLDSAMLNRFDLMIKFDLPDLQTRKELFVYYAKQFKEEQSTLDKLATETEGFSSREVKEICEHAERRYVSRQIKNNISCSKDANAPTIDDYLYCIQMRKCSTNQNKDESLPI